MQLIGPTDQAVEFLTLAQILSGIRVDKNLGDIAFADPGLLGGEEVDLRRGFRVLRRCHRVEHHVGTDPLTGGGDLIVQRYRRCGRGDDLEVAV